jgi:amino acid permease
MADIQRHSYDARVASARDLIRIRRRRATIVFVILAAASAFLAWREGSLNWLLLHLGIDACFAWYLAMLAQLRQRHAQRVANRYFSDSETVWEEFPVRVIASR